MMGDAMRACHHAARDGEFSWSFAVSVRASSTILVVQRRVVWLDWYGHPIYSILEGRGVLQCLTDGHGRDCAAASTDTTFVRKTCLARILYRF